MSKVSVKRPFSSLSYASSPSSSPPRFCGEQSNLLGSKRNFEEMNVCMEEGEADPQLMFAMQPPAPSQQLATPPGASHQARQVMQDITHASNDITMGQPVKRARLPSQGPGGGPSAIATAFASTHFGALASDFRLGRHHNAAQARARPLALSSSSSSSSSPIAPTLHTQSPHPLKRPRLNGASSFTVRLDEEKKESVFQTPPLQVENFVPQKKEKKFSYEQVCEIVKQALVERDQEVRAEFDQQFASRLAAEWDSWMEFHKASMFQSKSKDTPYIS